MAPSYCRFGYSKYNKLCIHRGPVLLVVFVTTLGGEVYKVFA